ncbi:hypothetical protein [uncultured Alcanivorax sp.]|jgi:hypothetical protein|uniref:hypothetical protein n=1 Tax=uncultured Alcanivorax sp. TaxID=191215 RepID=UPI0025864CB3|nr:hypothetical protein [uncultured Alcanivorax sp.]
MSIALVKEQIQEFLADDTPEVLAIRGDWGVGKTFTWNTFLTAAAESQSVSLDNYSYVSLFGINSLENFKFSIFEQVVDVKERNHKPSLESFRKSTEKISKSLGRKAVRTIQGLPYAKDLSPVFEAISFLSLRKTLICIDDIERKGDSLKIKDILGLVSLLKEQKDCKIVLILNNKSLCDNEENELNKYREKVIDIDLVFSPSAKESAQIAIPESIPNSEQISELTTKLNINNIRIIRKILRLAEKLPSILSDYEPGVINQGLHSLILFSYSYYQGGNPDVPPFDYIKNIGGKLWGIGNDKATAEEVAWNDFLSGYSLKDIDAFDLEIAKAVEKGVFNKPTLKKEAEKINEKFIARKSEASISKAWNKYHFTFEDNESDLIDSLLNSFKTNPQHISVLNLNGTVDLLRDLGYNKEANEIIELYIAEFQDKRETFDLDTTPFSERVNDKTLLQRFKEEHEKINDDRDPDQVLDTFVNNNAWKREDIILLSRATAEQYYKIFKKTKGEKLPSYIRACLRFERIANIGDNEKVIAQNARQALTRIAKESKLNALRAKRFGISLNTDPPESQ